jgi:hypothetical protein
MHMILFCRNRETASSYHGYHPMDATVGEMDWLWELHHTLEQEGLKPMSTVDPNERQIGGQHYREANALYQHWDLVAEYGLSYFTGNITKYATRWRNKEGVKDVEKAVHYTDKLISLYVNELFNFHARVIPTQMDRLYRYCDEQHLTALETEAVELATGYRSMHDLRRLRAVLLLLLEQAQAQGRAAPASAPPAQP